MHLFKKYSIVCTEIVFEYFECAYKSAHVQSLLINIIFQLVLNSIK